MEVAKTQTLELNIKDILLRGSALGILGALLFIVLNTDLRSNLRSALTPNYREILAVTQADLDHSGVKAEILKVKTNEGLFLEVYKPSKVDKAQKQELVASTQLPDKKDGYFTFNGEVTNLAVDDVNNDNNLEILATTFDNDLVAHLNVYRYIPGQRELELVRLN